VPVDDILELDELTDDGAPMPRRRGRSAWIVFAALGFAPSRRSRSRRRPPAASTPPTAT